MKTGNYENALIRFETRIGSPMLSDVVRGLVGVGLLPDVKKSRWCTSCCLLFP